MFCNWNGLREDSLYRPTLYVSQFKSKAVFDSDFQSVLDYGFLVRETNGSGFRSLVGSWIPWWAECPGIRIPQAKISRIPEFGLPGDSKWLKDGVCVFFGGHFIFFGRLLCDLEPRNFGGSGTIGNFENSRRSIHLPTHYRPCINEIR